MIRLGTLICCLMLMAVSAKDRNEKLLSIFSLIRFPNDPCPASGDQTGTCYTNAECEQRGGTNGGSCASNYGVCCVFVITCGETSTDNGTYFNSPMTFDAECVATICPVNEDITQIRLDFNSFTITGPSTDLGAVGRILNGQLIPDPTLALGQEGAISTRCATDQFSVLNGAGPNPPVICGMNSNQHMYVDFDASSGACLDLAFSLGAAGIGANIADRMWSIRVSQYSRFFENLAPKGCTQFFYEGEGSDADGSGTVQTYNFDGDLHLANQRQTICVRRERNNCRLCWTATNNADFGISVMDSLLSTTEHCCSHGMDGAAQSKFDCASFFGAVKTTGTNLALAQVCGDGSGLFIKTAGGSVAAGATICTFQMPFTVVFRSDDYEEVAMETILTNVGFRLMYEQDAQFC